MNQENKTPHNFCETPEEKCTMNYCDENGCQNRKRHLVVENKLPTAEEILKQEVLKVTNGMGYEHNVTHKGIISAIHIYKDLHTTHIREELEKFRAENERLKKANTRLLERVEEESEKYCNSLDQVTRLCEMMLSAQDQNQKLREALGQVNAVIANEDYYMDWSKTTNEIENIVLGALKGGSDE